MLRLTYALLVCLALANAQPGRPNFSGAWELDNAKSDFGGMGAPKRVTLAITHKEPAITVRTTMEVAQGEIQSEANYTTTGFEDTNRDQATTTKTRGRWEPKHLVVEGYVEAQGQRLRLREQWSLADEGKTFINERLLVLPNREVRQKLVYTRTK
jgi:hypothetical protein